MLAIEILLPAHTRGSRVPQASFSSLHMTNATINCQKRLSLALGVSFSVGGAWAFASEVKGFATEPSSSLSPRQTHSDVSIPFLLNSSIIPIHTIKHLTMLHSPSASRQVVGRRRLIDMSADQRIAKNYPQPPPPPPHLSSRKYSPALVPARIIIETVLTLSQTTHQPTNTSSPVSRLQRCYQLTSSLKPY
jgi:hypothetical protein